MLTTLRLEVCAVYICRLLPQYVRHSAGYSVSTALHFAPTAAGSSIKAGIINARIRKYMQASLHTKHIMHELSSTQVPLQITGVHATCAKPWSLTTCVVPVAAG
jgi:hypothetical protein